MPAYVVTKFTFIFGLIILLSPIKQSIAANFAVKSAGIEQIGNGYNLNAEINYPLTPRVKEALNNGVPITFLQQIEIIRSFHIIEGYWTWDTVLWSSNIRYELRYHALTKQYVVNAIDTGNYRNFISLDEALSAIGKISSLNLPPKYMQNTENLFVRIRSGIDILALPTPMRPGALLSKKWQVTSPWVNAKWL